MKYKRTQGGLKRPYLVSWRVNDLEYEFIARRCYDKSIAEENRKFWFKPGWEKELEKYRCQQRAAEIPDIIFIHSQARVMKRNGHRK